MEEDWEMLYTDSNVDEWLVNQICINVNKKLYILQLDVTSDVTETVEENGEPIGISSYISQQLFNLIVKSLKQEGFKETTWKEVEQI